MIPSSLLDDFVSTRARKPSTTQYIRYLFLTFGVSYIEFRDLPIPYIIEILNTHVYIKQQEEKELKKIKR